MKKKMEQVLQKQETGMPVLWTKNFILICLSSLSIFLGFHILIPTLPVYIERFGGMSGAAGWPLAALTIGAVLIRPLTGWALDSYGRKMLLLGGIIFFLLPTILYVWMIPAAVLIVLRFVQGLGWGIANTASNTVASDIVPLKRMGEGMGYFTVTLSLSMAIAPALGLWMIDRYSFSLMFITSLVLVVLSLVLALLIKYPPFEKRTGKVSFVFMEKKALRPAIVILSLTFTYSAILSFLPLYAIKQDLPAIGLFFTAVALSTLAARPLSGRIVDKRGEKGYDLAIIVGSLALFVAMFLVARVTNSLELVIAGVFYGTGFGFVQPTMLALSINSVPREKRGAANATYWTAFDIGVAVGSIIWGPVAAALGYKMMFSLTGIPVAVALCVYFMKNTFVVASSKG